MTDPKKPPQLTPYNAAAFQLDDVVAQYHMRTPYPSSLPAFLRDLTEPRGGRVLELGCGTGEIARGLTPMVERVDAVDISAPMLRRARTMPGGDSTAIRWIESAAEEAPLDGPYALAVAGDSLHWMDWDVVLPRIRDHLAPAAVLAIVHAGVARVPWWTEITRLFAAYSVIRDHVDHSLVDELESRRLFRKTGEAKLPAERYTRTVDEYIGALHATASLPRERMGADRSAAFDAEVRTLVTPQTADGLVEMETTAVVVWGAPAPIG